MVHDSNQFSPGGEKKLGPRSARNLLKLHLLKERINLPAAEADRFMEIAKLDLAQLLGILPTAIDSDVEFAGQELDLIFTFEPKNVTFGKPKR